MNDLTTMTVRVPLPVRRRGGRRAVLTPSGSSPSFRGAQADVAMIKAVARAFRWRKLIENGKYATIEEIAQEERINSSYVARVVRLTLLAPEIVEAILDGRQPIDLALRDLLRPFPVVWAEQWGRK